MSIVNNLHGDFLEAASSIFYDSHHPVTGCDVKSHYGLDPDGENAKRQYERNVDGTVVAGVVNPAGNDYHLQKIVVGFRRDSDLDSGSN